MLQATALVEIYIVVFSKITYCTSATRALHRRLGPMVAPILGLPLLSDRLLGY